MDKFCYLGDMLSVEGDADAAVEARIRVGWNKFRHLVPLLTNKDISLFRRGKLYSSCVQSSMLHGSETWPVRKENKKPSCRQGTAQSQDRDNALSTTLPLRCTIFLRCRIFWRRFGLIEILRSLVFFSYRPGLTSM